jgi:hypothetical protein
MKIGGEQFVESVICLAYAFLGLCYLHSCQYALRRINSRQERAESEELACSAKRKNTPRIDYTLFKAAGGINALV